MRTDRRYTRTRDMLLDEAVPRLSSGGIALCHICQRSVYFAGGFLSLLLRKLERMADDACHGRCPRCGSGKFYNISRGQRLRCSECTYERSATSGTARHSGKKPASWYRQIADLADHGLNPYQIARRVGSEAKAVYAYLRRREVDQRIAALTQEK